MKTRKCTAILFILEVNLMMYTVLKKKCLRTPSCLLKMNLRRWRTWYNVRKQALHRRHLSMSSWTSKPMNVIIVMESFIASIIWKYTLLVFIGFSQTEWKFLSALSKTASLWLAVEFATPDMLQHTWESLNQSQTLLNYLALIVIWLWLIEVVWEDMWRGGILTSDLIYLLQTNFKWAQHKAVCTALVGCRLMCTGITRWAN